VTLGGIPHIFAEYIDGGSLADWIRRRTLYKGGPEQALQHMLDVAIQSAWELHYTHEQGLVHQDVKPANTMMTTSGIAKVTDLGLARARVLAGEEQGAKNRSEHVGQLGRNDSRLLLPKAGSKTTIEPQDRHLELGSLSARDVCGRSNVDGR
jgi:serine/threonine protein kinase